MNNLLKGAAAFALLCTSILWGQDAANTLRIYWIDVEGGAATLIVTPEQDSILMDAGWNREDERDAQRIQAAMRDAGVNDIDYFLASHFHGDHVGGVPALARRVTINNYVDHGDSVEQDTERGRPAWEAYLSSAQSNRQTVRPGDHLTVSGIDFRFVASNRHFLDPPAGRQVTNTHCDNVSAVAETPGENSRSLGYMISLGDFQFLDLGDLTVDLQHGLACPQNRLGEIDLLQVPHHGQGVAAPLVWALQPTVAVMNNGAHKGGRAEDLEVVRNIPGSEGFWQLHRALDAPVDMNTSERMTANLTEEDDAGHWIKATVAHDGRSYSIVNGRNGFSQTYSTK